MGTTRDMMLITITLILMNIAVVNSNDDIDDFMFSSKNDTPTKTEIKKNIREDQNKNVQEVTAGSVKVERILKPGRYNISGFERSKIQTIRPIALKSKLDTNSHRPQYNADSLEKEFSPPNISRLEKKTPTPSTYRVEDVEASSTKPVLRKYQVSNLFRAKENNIKMAVLRALSKKDNMRGFSEVVPIIKMMSPSQRLTLAAVVSSQLGRSDRGPGLNLDQVRTMFSNTPNATSELMLPIILDIANMFKRGARIQRASPFPPSDSTNGPQTQFLRRSYNLEDDGEYYTDQVEADVKLIDEPFKVAVDDSNDNDGTADDDSKENEDEFFEENDLHVTELSDDLDRIMTNLNGRNDTRNKTIPNGVYKVHTSNETKADNEEKTNIVFVTRIHHQNSSATNTTLKDTDMASNSSASDLPVAEKLRALNRFVDRNGNLVVIRRPPWSQKGTHPARPHPNRRISPELRKRLPTRKPLPELQGLLEMAKQNCELFTNSLCLDVLDYPSDAILSSIRRNKAAAGALLADFKDLSSPSNGAVDGVPAKQEADYTPEHYINFNRREDGGNSIRDFAGAGEAGYMCPSMVKYARPQRARATSGLWKYIVNTGEHTQTLRLEKCLKPKEPCTYLTDNFKSKCVQVYNYHRLLTWDQQNGLHMDIFKVPTCCSCHIEGYSVNFPPLPGKNTELTPEHFPNEDLTQEAESNPYEHAQSSVQHQTTSSFSQPKRPETYSVFGGDGSNNIIPGSSFQTTTFFDDEPNAQQEVNHFAGVDTFDPDFDSFHQGSSIRNLKKPLRGNQNGISVFDAGASLPSFLEPPSKTIGSTATTFFKNPDLSSKLKFSSSQYKRAPSKRPARRPIRKKNGLISQGDLISDASSIKNPTIINMDTFDDINGGSGEVDMMPSTSTQKTIKHYIPVSKFVSNGVSSTTERHYKAQTTKTPRDQGTAILKDISLNRRVNYNYHPIIDFFENGVRKEVDHQAADRADGSGVFGQDSEWRPMAVPLVMAQVAPSRVIPTSST